MGNLSNKLSFKIALVIAIILYITPITIYRNSYSNLDNYVIIYHLYLITIFGALLILVGLALKAMKLNIPKIYAIIWAFFYLFLFIVYLFAFSGNNLVGSPITFNIAYTYLKQINNLLKAVNAPIAGTYLITFIILLSYFTFFIWLSKNIWKSLDELKDFIVSARNTKAKKNTIIKIMMTILLMIIILFSIDFFKFTNLNTRLYVAKEPIYLIFSPKKIGNISLSKNKEQISVATNYPKNLNFKKKNVIIIIVDDLRADYLSAYGYPQQTSPFLNKLVADKNTTKVKYAFSNASASFSGILSILTSKLWTNIAQQNFAIHDLLKRQGYQVNFILSGDHTSFYLLRDIFGNNIDYYQDGYTAKNYYLNDDALVLEKLKKVKIKPDNSNFFYLHLMSTHNLGIRKEENKAYKPASAISKDRIAYQNNYKNGILQTDNYIKEIFEVLKTRKLLDNSLVIITADHGESLGEDGLYGHGNNVKNRETMIPLIIYDSDVNTTYYDEYATQEDISPTIIDKLGLPKPLTWEGQSLLNHKRIRKYSYLCYKDSFAIISHEDNRLIKYIIDRKVNKEEIFDLKTDPHESMDIINSISKQELLIFRKLMKKFISDTL